MDAVKFIKEYNRMCQQYSFTDNDYDCSKECPLYNTHCQIDSSLTNALMIAHAVEQWSQDHPQKTMMQDFFEKFPNAPKTAEGLPRNVCPRDCGYTNEPPDTSVCNKFDDDCLECWSRPLED